MSTQDALFEDDALGGPPMRVLVMWYPDWPVVACAPEAMQEGLPIAIMDGGTVLACSPAARGHGVRRGMRRREAQSRLPALRCQDYQPEHDARAFEPLLAAVERVSPGVELVRPGMCATASRGPTRYFGSEEQVIDAIGDYLEVLGFPGAQFGIADGTFAAIQAAKADQIVRPGESARFLRELPVETLERPELADVLRRLGLRTLGAFAQLPSNQVAARFGSDGIDAHRLASGRERRRLAIRTPPPELTIEVTFDQPLERIDQVAFAVRRHADDFVAQLAARDVVCTSLHICIEAEDQSVSTRLWRHPHWFTPADVVDRVRWQLHAATPAGQGVSFGRTDAGSLTGPISRVSLEPREIDRTGMHADELWESSAPNEQVHRAFTRIQSILDHTAVVTAVPSGGRGPRDSWIYAPWGERAVHLRDPDAPWPGRLPDPAPTRLVSPPWSVLVRGRHEAVQLDSRGFLTEEPADIVFRDRCCEPILEWSGPWSSDERWWDTTAALNVTRIQAITANTAYLLALDKSSWWVEGIYD